jgi:hypothetical protein
MAFPRKIPKRRKHFDKCLNDIDRKQKDDNIHLDKIQMKGGGLSFPETFKALKIRMILNPNDMDDN